MCLGLPSPAPAHQPPAGPRKETKCNCAGTAAAAALLSRCSGINELVQLDTVWTVDTELEFLNFDNDTVINDAIFVECALWHLFLAESAFSREDFCRRTFPYLKWRQLL